MRGKNSVPAAKKAAEPARNLKLWRLSLLSVKAQYRPSRRLAHRLASANRLAPRWCIGRCPIRFSYARRRARAGGLCQVRRTMVARKRNPPAFIRCGIPQRVCNAWRGRNHLAEHAKHKHHPISNRVVATLALDHPSAQVNLIRDLLVCDPRHSPDLAERRISISTVSTPAAVSVQAVITKSVRMEKVCQLAWVRIPSGISQTNIRRMLDASGAL